MFSFSSVNRETRTRFEKLVGPFGMGLLTNSSELVISGSIVLDAMEGTNFAGDIDIFCVERAALTALTLARKCGFEVKCYSRGTHYTHGARARYQVLCPHHTFDFVVCNSPLDLVADFDLPHNKVAFDGVFLWTHKDWLGPGVTMITDPCHQVDAFFKRLSDLVSDNLYDSIHQDFHTLFIRKMIRIGKYNDRGYQILDEHQHPIYLDETRRLLLQKLAKQKSESEFEVLDYSFPQVRDETDNICSDPQNISCVAL